MPTTFGHAAADSLFRGDHSAFLADYRRVQVALVQVALVQIALMQVARKRRRAFMYRENLKIRE